MPTSHRSTRCLDRHQLRQSTISHARLMGFSTAVVVDDERIESGAARRVEELERELAFAWTF